jgi:hypothetical protein
VTGPDVGLEHEADPRRASGDCIDRAPDHVHDLVPLPLDGREHRVGVVRQAGLADHADRIGNVLGD